MAGHNRSLAQRLWQTLSSVRTGIILLMVVVVFSAAGTLVLQRPTTDPDELQPGSPNDRRGRVAGWCAGRARTQAVSGSAHSRVGPFH